jgi:ADP-ribose pyrophosphatase YjhB (NUDIX family)
LAARNHQALVAYVLFKIMIETDIAHQQVLTLYSERLRLRVCGICVQNQKILMINHAGVVKDANFWCPPGGGLQFGESTIEALQREFQEETQTEVAVGKMLFVNEFLELPLHAIEVFFEVQITEGKAQKGFDPEMSDQIIQEVCWMSFEEIKALPPHEVHRVFSLCESLDELLKLQGFLSK